jgi:thioredoxin-related protein
LQQAFSHDIVLYGKKIDVKTMIRNVEPRLEFINNLSHHQTDYQLDAYIFCSFNATKEVLTVCGWLPKAKLAKVGTFIRAGTERERKDGSIFTAKHDFWEIPNSALSSPRSAQELLAELKGFAEVTK